MSHDTLFCTRCTSAAWRFLQAFAVHHRGYLHITRTETLLRLTPERITRSANRLVSKTGEQEATHHWLRAGLLCYMIPSRESVGCCYDLKLWLSFHWAVVLTHLN